MRSRDLATISAGMMLMSSCAKPIQTSLYTRTPLGGISRPIHIRGGPLRIGMGCEDPTSAMAFIRYARNRGAFGFMGWARPVNLDTLDYQIDCTLSFEHEGNDQVHYCLGRIVANIYNADHSQLLARVMRFHEAMYTANPKTPAFAHDGQDIVKDLQEALFNELIAYLNSDVKSDTALTGSSISRNAVRPRSSKEPSHDAQMRELCVVSPGSGTASPRP